MATTSLQSAIDIANRRHASANRRAHLKRASDTQWREHAEKVMALVIDAYREEFKKGLRIGNNFHEALREQDAFLHLVGKRK